MGKCDQSVEWLQTDREPQVGPICQVSCNEGVVPIERENIDIWFSKTPNHQLRAFPFSSVIFTNHSKTKGQIEQAASLFSPIAFKTSQI